MRWPRLSTAAWLVALSPLAALPAVAVLVLSGQTVTPEDAQFAVVLAPLVALCLVPYVRGLERRRKP